MSSKLKRLRLSLLSRVSLASCALGAAIGPMASQVWAQDKHVMMPGMAMGAGQPAAGATQSTDQAEAVGQALEAGMVADVVVTGVDDEVARQEEKMMEVMMHTPRSGDVVTGTQAREEQLNRLSDLSQLVPNYRPNITTPYASRAAIRGVGIAAGQTGVGSQSETGFVVDNVPWITPAFQWADFVDLDAFELTLGPTGTAGGHNTDVGNINIHTQLPSFAQKATFETTYGNYGHFIEKLNVTGPIIDDHLAFRFSFYRDAGEGWIRDGGDGVTYLNNNRWGTRLQLLGIGDGITDRLIFSFTSSNEFNGFATGTIGDTSLVYANGTRPTSFFSNVATKLGKPILTTNPYSPHISREGTEPALVTTLSNELNWQIGANTLTSITAQGYAATRQKDFSDDQELQLGTGTGSMDTYVLQTSQELRLSSPKEQKLEWVTGLYSLYENAWNKMHHGTFGNDTAAWIGDPAALAGLADRLHSHARDIQIAAYGQGTYHFDEQWALTFGLRDSYDIRYGSVTHIPLTIPGTKYTWAQQNYALIGAGGSTSGAADTGGLKNYHNGLMGIFNPQYKFNENVLLYALVGRGDKAPAVNTSDNPVYVNKVFQGFTQMFTKPETSWDYEIGAKTNWFDGKVISNINFYWNDLHNFQNAQTSFITATNGATSPVTYLGSTPHVRLRGVEFIERWNPIDGLTLHATAAYTEARYIDYAAAASPADFTFSGGPKTMSLSNTRITGIPWWTLSMGVTYEQPLGAAFRDLGPWANIPVIGLGYANFDWFNKTQLTDPRSIYQYWQPAYAIVNAGVGLRTDDGKYSLILWGKNLFNALPWTAYSLGTSTTPTTVGISTQGPRFYGATLTVTL